MEPLIIGIIVLIIIIIIVILVVVFVIKPGSDSVTPDTTKSTPSATPAIAATPSVTAATPAAVIILPRQTITDLGYPDAPGNLTKGWYDMQKQGIANDYCSYIGPDTSPSSWHCALAGGTGYSNASDTTSPAPRIPAQTCKTDTCNAFMNDWINNKYYAFADSAHTTGECNSCPSRWFTAPWQTSTDGKIYTQNANGAAAFQSVKL